MPAPFADLGLAHRLEALAAEEMRRFVTTARSIEPDGVAEALEVAGGVAVFVAPGSAVNQAVGFGFDGPVMDAHVEAVERFFAKRAARAVMAVCPLAHPTLVESLGHRGWVVEGFENVLVCSLDGVSEAPGRGPVRVIEVESDAERELWTMLAATGFSAPLDPTTEQFMLCGLVTRRPGTRLFLASVDGMPAGTGELYMSDGVAWLSADATLPQFRGRGVQTALQARRLAVAAEAGCELAVSEAAPGGASQRNMQRHGFSVAYTRVDFAVPRPEHGGPGAPRTSHEI